MAPTTLPSRSASRRSTAASALSSNNPPYLVSVNATLLCPAHSETLTYVAARSHHDRDKAVPKAVEGDVVRPSAQHRRPQDSTSSGAEERATCRCGEDERICPRVNKLRDMRRPTRGRAILTRASRRRGAQPRSATDSAAASVAQQEGARRTRD